MKWGGFKNLPETSYNMAEKTDRPNIWASFPPRTLCEIADIKEDIK